MKDLKGKVALVTGAAMGMGKSLSEDLLKEGCRVVLVDVNQTELANTRKELSKIGKCADYICDISDRPAVYQLAKQVEKEFGPGRWEGKAFHPVLKDKGYGYNIFKDEGGKLYRTRKMDTVIGPSDYDGKPAFKLNYGAYNSGTVQSMRDEIRKINDNLFLGLGYMALGGGKINPAPFALIGPAKEWVGVDQP